jgi:hypothetical protein
MKRLLLAGAAASALVFGLATAQAAPARADLGSGASNLAAADHATDLSSAKKKKKKKAMGGKSTGGGSSKAGTGGGAGGEGGAGASSERQTGTPRGNPATPTR